MNSKMNKLKSVFFILFVIIFFPMILQASNNFSGYHAKNVIQIVYDKAGIPHVIASSSLGLFYGFGYCVAKSRLFQLELLRRSVQGELSEILGDEYIEIDKQIKQDKLQFEHYSFQLQNAPSSFTQALHSFTAGLNAAIRKIKEKNYH